MSVETEAELRARHAHELRELHAEQKRIERRDDRDEKHLAKWLRKYHYEDFRAFAQMRDAESAARRETTRERVERHRNPRPDVTPGRGPDVTPDGCGDWVSRPDTYEGHGA